MTTLIFANISFKNGRLVNDLLLGHKNGGSRFRPRMSLLESLSRLQISLICTRQFTTLVDFLAREPRHKDHQNETYKELEGEEDVTFPVVTDHVFDAAQGGSKVGVQRLCRQQSDARCERVLKNTYIGKRKHAVLESKGDWSQSKESNDFDTVLPLDDS